MNKSAKLYAILAVPIQVICGCDVLEDQFSYADVGLAVALGPTYIVSAAVHGSIAETDVTREDIQRALDVSNVGLCTAEQAAQPDRACAVSKLRWGIDNGIRGADKPNGRVFSCRVRIRLACAWIDHFLTLVDTSMACVISCSA